MDHTSLKYSRFSNREMLELYRRVGVALCASVFGEHFGATRSVSNAIDRLKNLRKLTTREQELDVFDAVIAQADTLMRRTIAYRNGVKGEDLLAKALSHLDLPNRRLASLGVAIGNAQEEIDHVVVTRHCVFVVESKYFNTSYDIDIHGLLQQKYQSCSYDIEGHLFRKRAALRSLLVSICGESGRAIPIRVCLAFMNSRVKVHNHCPRIQWFYPGELLSYIERVTDSLGCASVLNPVALASAIKARSFVARFPPELDVGALYQGLCQIVPSMPENAWRSVFLLCGHESCAAL